jgi:hypothetical protein
MKDLNQYIIESLLDDFDDLEHDVASSIEKSEIINCIQYFTFFSRWHGKKFSDENLADPNIINIESDRGQYTITLGSKNFDDNGYIIDFDTKLNIKFKEIYSRAISIVNCNQEQLDNILQALRRKDSANIAIHIYLTNFKDNVLRFDFDKNEKIALWCDLNPDENNNINTIYTDGLYNLKLNGSSTQNIKKIACSGKYNETDLDIWTTVNNCEVIGHFGDINILPKNPTSAGTAAYLTNLKSANNLYYSDLPELDASILPSNAKVNKIYMRPHHGIVDFNGLSKFKLPTGLDASIIELSLGLKWDFEFKFKNSYLKHLKSNDYEKAIIAAGLVSMPSNKCTKTLFLAKLKEYCSRSNIKKMIKSFDDLQPNSKYFIAISTSDKIQDLRDRSIGNLQVYAKIETGDDINDCDVQLINRFKSSKIHIDDLKLLNASPRLFECYPLNKDIEDVWDRMEEYIDSMIKT